MYQECLRVKEELKNNEISGIAIDIDETIADTNFYWANYLLKNFSNPEKFTATEIILKYKYCYRVPYWQGKELEWVENHIKSSSAKLEIPVIKGAINALRSIQQIVPVVAYITGRPRSTNKGTYEWLRNNNFPSAHILAAPSKEVLQINQLSGNKWKAKALNILSPEIIGIVDDNPNVIEESPTKYQGKFFLYSYKTYNSTKNVITCETWDKVVDEINKFANSKYKLF